MDHFAFEAEPHTEALSFSVGDDKYAKSDDETRLAGHFPGVSQVWVTGDSVPEIIGKMFYAVAQDARHGRFNPNNLSQRSSTPIQHVMDLLTEFLHARVGDRRASLDSWGRAEKAVDADKAEFQFKHDNEVISALGTAISALARVRDV